MKFIPNELYNNIIDVVPIICVDAIIISNQKCLLLKRNNNPEKNSYWFPGGRIIKNEFIQDAVIRKAKEETNITCSYKKILSIEETIFKADDIHMHGVHTINICCELIASERFEIKLDNNHSSHIWVDICDNSYHPSINNVLKKLFQKN